MLGFALLLKSLVQKMRNSINESPVYASFSYISASKPVGRIDPSRFETVNSASPVRRPGALKNCSGLHPIRLGSHGRCSHRATWYHLYTIGSHTYYAETQAAENTKSKS